MSVDVDQRYQAGQQILAGVGRMTPGQVRGLSIRHVDAFSPERQAARARARSAARALGLVASLDGLLRDAARMPDMPLVPDRSMDTFRQLTADAAVAAFVGDDIDEDTRRLLTGPWTRATRRR